MKNTTPEFISLLLLGGALLSACGSEKKAVPASDSVTVADSTSGPTAL
ncbi:MAG: carbohydrate-binding protein, partial [Sphingobacteriales bacterium]